MKKTKLAILTTSLSALLLSMGAVASDLGASARSPGPGGVEPGIPTIPVYGGGATCYFAYHIRKVSLDDDHRNVNDNRGDGNDDRRGQARFKIFVTNIGNCDLRRIDVTDFLPDRTELVRADPWPDYRQDDKIVWKDVRLAVGERETFEVTVRRRDHDVSTTDHDHDRGIRIRNTGCAFTPWIGIRICDSALAFLDDDDHRQDHGPSLN